MNSTIYALAIIGALALVVLGIASFFILLSAFVARVQEDEQGRPPYEGDGGDEQEDEQGRALYGDVAVWPRKLHVN